MNFYINKREIGTGVPPYLVAELSANHNGSIERAISTIEAAKKVGADAVKIQTYTAETMTLNIDNPEFYINGGLWDGYKLYDLYKWAETPYEWHSELFNYARKIGITIFSTPFDESAVDLLESINTPAYKIASFEILDIPLIRYVASTGKPVIMSTGMATEDEIQIAVDAARDGGCKQLLLLHCISSYPTPINQANLLKIPAIKKRFNVLTGLSDHTLGITVAGTAIALGACFIEKHFTLSRNDKGPDSEFSINPKEFLKLKQNCNEIYKSLGDGSFERPDIEKESKIFRRSLYFSSNLPSGHILQERDIIRIRPGYGLSPNNLPNVIGKSLKNDVSYGTPVTWEVLK